MCGNDISTVVVPGQSFLQQLRHQMSTGKISIKNNPQGTKQTISMNQIDMIKRFDTTRLKQLELIRCDLTHQMIQQLAKCDFSNLRILSLNHNKIGPIGCRVIASCQTLNNLKTLELANNKIKDAGVKAIVTSKFDLQDLNLNDNGLTSDGIKSLKIFSAIQYLSLCGNNLNDQTADTIKNINPNGLCYLAISRNTFTNQSLRVFTSISKLQVLLIDRNKITTSKSQLNVPSSKFVFY